VSLPYQQNVNVSDITVTNFSHIILPTTRRQKPARIDMEREYVTVTLCIAAGIASGTVVFLCLLKLCNGNSRNP